MLLIPPTEGNCKNRQKGLVEEEGIAQETQETETTASVRPISRLQNHTYQLVEEGHSKIVKYIPLTIFN